MELVTFADASRSRKPAENSLDPFVGKSVAIWNIETDGNGTVSATLRVAEGDKLVGDEYELAMPKRVHKALIRAKTNAGDRAILASVVRGTRGISLR